MQEILWNGEKMKERESKIGRERKSGRKRKGERKIDKRKKCDVSWNCNPKSIHKAVCLCLLMYECIFAGWLVVRLKYCFYVDDTDLKCTREGSGQDLRLSPFFGLVPPPPPIQSQWWMNRTENDWRPLAPPSINSIHRGKTVCQKLTVKAPRACYLIE